MCRPTTCSTCQRTTWAGCGQHVDMVRASVPRSEWCNGSHTPEEIAQAKAARPAGFLGRLLGR
ncbi:hypothetical protein [Leucobacter sp. PH1c]|uniref:hypothetical protein n=1 Tax=Leucobacter sp. PH1c TaxID=1397278 RepID=UPI000468B65E|nr:hypothetical protein [Leucobacter sp. PH1c]